MCALLGGHALLCPNAGVTFVSLDEHGGGGSICQQMAEEGG